MKKVLVLMMVLSINVAFTQNQLKQTIRGVVMDNETQVTLPGAVVIVNSSLPLNAVTDIDGKFKITGVPIGRYDIRISFLGYEPFMMKEIMVGSGKEVVLNIGMKESVSMLKGVEIKATSNKEEALNPMAFISARQLSVEEAKRYAGGFDDPARLAASFAGVASSVGSNAIVIRGNAPKGLLWTIEGVEVSTPSHFANVTSFGGGGISALSSNLLSNSDFYTSAFPAEYGNATSGVFDIKMKVGNNEKREHTFQAGVIGIDFASEGPFVKGKKASYIFNYRYSTFALIAPVLPEFAGAIKYQDLSFKLNFPLKNNVFSIWGIAASDYSGGDAKKDSTEWIHTWDNVSTSCVQGMGGTGINLKSNLSKKAFLVTSLSTSGTWLDSRDKKYDASLNFHDKDKIIYNSWRYALSSIMNYKFSAKHTNKSGMNIQNLNYNIKIQNNIDGSGLHTFANEQGTSYLIHGFSQSKYNLSNNLTANLGVHTQYFTLNNNYSIEPRAGLSMNIGGGNMLTAGYGLHSQIEMLLIYFTEQIVNGNKTYPNKDLDFSKSHHFVLGYNKRLSENLRVKIEPYYQALFNIPTAKNSSFSLINLDEEWFISDKLTNSGTGRNIGVDFTFERFLKDGYYYLFTASIFDSKYKGGDGITRNTRYNKNYVVNILYGKEWAFSRRNREDVISMNGKVCFMGGDMMTPYDKQASLDAMTVIYDDTKAFTEQKPAVCNIDFSLSYRRNKEKHSSVWSFQIMNLLGNKEVYGYCYNMKENKIEVDKDRIIVPNLSYRIEF
ncbi:MAG: hypothetical protein A2X12_00400 [Bacteroidetes bacterium GWE2_29_8]|nr:MAG: hypothetical protein A2X12_00400 [Bacteroidetes bacterium GWE2_29_8]OFY14850.1 MAG: hypothetical protein A2X02_01525 [Bacteroidetes bacterium GWF2_29_10]